MDDAHWTHASTPSLLPHSLSLPRSPSPTLTLLQTPCHALVFQALPRAPAGTISSVYIFFSIISFPTAFPCSSFGSLIAPIVIAPAAVLLTRITTIFTFLLDSSSSPTSPLRPVPRKKNELMAESVEQAQAGEAGTRSGAANVQFSFK